MAEKTKEQRLEELRSYVTTYPDGDPRALYLEALADAWEASPVEGEKAFLETECAWDIHYDMRNEFGAGATGYMGPDFLGPCPPTWTVALPLAAEEAEALCGALGRFEALWGSEDDAAASEAADLMAQLGVALLRHLAATGPALEAARARAKADPESAPTLELWASAEAIACG